ncbi:Alpha carbonic anhydrase,Condensin complex subunit 2/barren,Carbonic anhydrase, alpha-class [Cinara cedri]|uniref:Carbonic anhydrase n=1 Tax=Cinara cedri TaxID=506608 RepID=A0A5E4MBT2_9HEMI|nr:Alpha carbonic anhydrase,Condensin complex subunit 2/barren,Carbonic anhydrase, alpha-class [Cinara cedri]
MAENHEATLSEIMKNEDKYANLAMEELTLKMKTYTTLCKNNKINSSNAFDIDMVGYFSTWLKKNKEASSNSDLEMFQVIADNLETCDKVYSLRIDNASTSTSKLVDEFKMMNQIEIPSYVDDSPKHQPFKRTKCMLTTDDKISYNLADREYISSPFLSDLRDFNFKKIFLKQKPSTYVNALYNNYSIKEEMDLKEENNKEDPNKPMYLVECDDMAEFQNQLAKEVLCPEFHGFVTDRDCQKNDDNDELEGVENNFYINNQDQYSLSASDDDNSPENDVVNFDEPSKLDSTPDIPEENNVAELVNCVDGVDRPFSNFNPKLFANFKGPKAWKTQTMIKSLKTCDLDEKKEIMATPSISKKIKSNLEPQTVINQKKQADVNIIWYKADKLEDKWPESSGSKISLSYRLSKWNAFNHIMSVKHIQSIIDNIQFQSAFLKTHQIKQYHYPDEPQENIFGTAFNFQTNNGFDEEIIENEEVISYDSDDSTADNEILEFKRHMKESFNVDFDQSFTKNDFQAEFKTETKMNISELKKEISEIIDKECIEIGTDNNWSNEIPFQTLLLKLTAKETRISLHIIFVALLHLTNERGYKLNQVPIFFIEESLKLPWTNEDLDRIPFSPIAVNTDQMCVINVPLLEFHNFEVKPERMNLRNNGRTVVLNGDWLTKEPFITGSNLKEKYRFSHLHFHWSDDENGSEHVINGQRHTLEMHLIFVNESFGMFDEAELNQRGIVTLAYLFDIQSEPHFGVDHVTNLCKNLTYGQIADVPVFPLSHLTNKHMHEEYFTYLGKYFKYGEKFGVSQWIVFTKAGGVSYKQMEQFRNMLNKRSHIIKRNCRPTEPIKNTGMSPFLVKQLTAICHTTPSFEGTQDLCTTTNAVLRRNSLCLIRECSSLRAEQSNITLPETVPRMTGRMQRLLCAKPTRTHLLRTKHNLCKMESINYKNSTSNSSTVKINQTLIEDDNSIPMEQLQLVQLDNYRQYNVDSKYKLPPWK